MKQSILLLLFFLSSTTGFAQEDNPVSKDEAAIRGAAETYQKAYNDRDAAKLAKHFTKDAELATGQEILRGREAIEKDYSSLFESGEVPKLALEQVQIDVISPAVAIETGVAILTRDAETQSVPYRAVHVKTDSGWLLDRVQDEPAVEAPPSNYDKLKVIEWLVGSWVLETENSSTTLSCRWTPNRNFLVQSYSVVGDAGVQLEGTQVIGWDPSRNRLRSWLFDSDGGFGSGAWTGEGDNWTVKTLQVVPSGEEASSTNMYRKVDDDTIEFSSIGRQVGGKLLKNIAAAKFVRQ